MGQAHKESVFKKRVVTLKRFVYQDNL